MSALDIDYNSVSWKVDAGGAKPGVFIRETGMMLHLTKNATQEAINGPAFNATVSMKAAANSQDERDRLEDYQIGFIQVCRSNQCLIQYAGRTDAEGMVTLSPMDPPASTTRILLDSDTKFSPFTQAAPGRYKFEGGVLTATTGDHPACKLPRKISNATTNVSNSLFRVRDNREFWSVFSLIRPNNSFVAGLNREYISLLHWQVVYDFTFSWSISEPKVEKSSSSFKILGNSKGPIDTAVRTILDKPGGPQYNDALPTALKATVAGGQSANRKDTAHWVADSGITPSFWT